MNTHDERERCTWEFAFHHIAFHTVLEILCSCTNQIILMSSLPPACSFSPCACGNVADMQPNPPTQDCDILAVCLQSGLSAHEQRMSSQTWAKATLVLLYKSGVVRRRLPEGPRIKVSYSLGRYRTTMFSHKSSQDQLHHICDDLQIFLKSTFQMQCEPPHVHSILSET